MGDRADPISNGMAGVAVVPWTPRCTTTAGESLVPGGQHPREQFRVAAGEPLGYDDPPLRGHSIEFRINAMKMEQPLTAHKAGTVVGPSAEIGATVASGAVICEIKDPAA